MGFDFKKEYKEFYLPPQTPSIVDVPPMNHVAVRGKGDPNDEDSEYKASIELLYGIAFTIKMSKMGDHRIDGYFDFVVPPLEGLWWSETGEVDYARKQDFHFISMIRLPDFVTKADFDWAVETASKKKKKDFSQVEFFHYEEGKCVQCMHVGSYDMEPLTIGKMKALVTQEGLSIDTGDKRMHHEIYLSDPRKTAADKLKTVIPFNNPLGKIRRFVPRKAPVIMRLQQATLQDYTSILAFYDDVIDRTPDIGRHAWWQKGKHPTAEGVRAYIEEGSIYLCRETGEPVGCMGYYAFGESNIDIGEDDAELGYWIARPYWNQGLCTEALRAMVSWCFGVKGFQALWSDFFVDNPASGRVMEKCGFRDTGEVNWCSHLYRGDERPVKVMRLDYALD